MARLREVATDGAFRELAELDAAIVTAKQRVRDVEGELRAAKAKVEEARNAVIEGYAAGSDDAAIKKLEKAHAEAVSSVARLTDAKMAGVQRAQQRAEADRTRFVAENYEALLDERRPNAERAARGVEGALAALVEAHAAWLATEGR